MIYIATFLLLLFPAIWFDILGKNGNKKVWFYICLAALVLLAGLRYRVGCDTIRYMAIFESYPGLCDLTDFKWIGQYYPPGWCLLNIIFSTFGKSGYFVMQFVLVAFINTSILLFFKRYCKCPFIATATYFLAFYLTWNTEIFREATCIAIFLFAYPLIEKRKFIKYFLLCILASTIHYFAIILIFVPLFSLIKKEPFITMAVVVIAVMTCWLFLDFSKILSEIKINVNSGFTYYLNDRISYYSNMPKLSKWQVFDIIVTCLPFLGVFLTRFICKFDNDKQLGIIASMIIFFQFFGILIYGVGRLSNYFILFGIILAINTLYINWNKIFKKWLPKIIVICSIFVFVFNNFYYYTRNQNAIVEGSHIYDRYYPYHSVFDKKTEPLREKYAAVEFEDSTDSNNQE